MKKSVIILGIGVWIVFLTGSSLPAGEKIDSLIGKMVEKGLLTPEEGAEVLADEEKAGGDEGEPGQQPEWLKRISFGGDLRLRYQWQKTSGSEDRQRGRIRLRLGAAAEILDSLTVGFRLATGSDDPRSTNQTLEDTFQTPDIRLDYAYGRYDPVDGVGIILGKFENPLYRPSSLLWDSDINPDGASVLFETEAADPLLVFLNTGFWILDEEKNDTRDPVMWVFQPGLNWDLIEDKIYWQAAVAYYGFANVRGNTLDHSAGSNTRETDDPSAEDLKYNYDSISVSSELGLSRLFDPIPWTIVFGEYIHNFDPSRENNGWLIGVRIGAKKVKKPHQWQVKYSYRRLERDAWLDTFPDADFYGGATNVQGHKVSLVYSPLDHVSLGINYFHAEMIEGEADPQDLFQADIILKF